MYIQSTIKMKKNIYFKDNGDGDFLEVFIEESDLPFNYNKKDYMIRLTWRQFFKIGSWRVVLGSVIISLFAAGVCFSFKGTMESSFCGVFTFVAILFSMKYLMDTMYESNCLEWKAYVEGRSESEWMMTPVWIGCRYGSPVTNVSSDPYNYNLLKS